MATPLPYRTGQSMPAKRAALPNPHGEPDCETDVSRNKTPILGRHPPQSLASPSHLRRPTTPGEPLAPTSPHENPASDDVLQRRRRDTLEF
ncbi:hypothetical protein DBB29_02465 [Pandoraea cepalis]|uniref:Uncharacterized protein n=1 Tax=Pandoraea cepalis TaxID=2508294 RepID=A0AAW7MII8_9BURK|nr:hypothetical protein [Pandoraea cepalis]MDN4576988.1 hypothetical protein [Pandoraea cepalis]